MNCMFTGHRPSKFSFGHNEKAPACLALKEQIEREIRRAIADGFDTFLTGMAMGVDTYAAEIVLRLKRTDFPELKLYAVIPCPEQTRHWSNEARWRYEDILQGCDGRYMMSAAYTPTCMMERNRFLVEHSERCIAVWDGSPGGTANTVHYAEAKGVPIVRIIP